MEVFFLCIKYLFPTSYVASWCSVEIRGGLDPRVIVSGNFRPVTQGLQAELLVLFDLFTSIPCKMSFEKNNCLESPYQACLAIAGLRECLRIFNINRAVENHTRTQRGRRKGEPIQMAEKRLVFYPRNTVKMRKM